MDAREANSDRQYETLSMRDALSEDYRGAAVRKTGKSIEEWNEEFRRRLVADVEHGTLNPDRWFLPYHITGLATRYGLADEDDLVFDLVDIKIIQNLYPDYKTPINQGGKVAERALAARLNPEKYWHLAGIYGSKRMRRLV